MTTLTLTAGGIKPLEEALTQRREQRLWNHRQRCRNPEKFEDQKGSDKHLCHCFTPPQSHIVRMQDGLAAVWNMDMRGQQYVLAVPREGRGQEPPSIFQGGGNVFEKAATRICVMTKA